MAGRRLRSAVRDILVHEGGLNGPIITIAGLANSYTHSVTTIEEYVAQRYEAASTLYGPHTLQAYIQEFQRITRGLLQDKLSASDPAPPDLSTNQISLLSPVELDTIGIGKKFGSMAIDADEESTVGDKVWSHFDQRTPGTTFELKTAFFLLTV